MLFLFLLPSLVPVFIRAQQCYSETKKLQNKLTYFAQVCLNVTLFISVAKRHSIQNTGVEHPYSIWNADKTNNNKAVKLSTRTGNTLPFLPTGLQTNSIPQATDLKRTIYIIFNYKIVLLVIASIHTKKILFWVIFQIELHIYIK